MFLHGTLQELSSFLSKSKGILHVPNIVDVLESKSPLLRHAVLLMNGTGRANTAGCANMKNKACMEAGHSAGTLILNE